MEAVCYSSLNVLQCLSQLYILLLRVHYTPFKLHKMGLLVDPLCSKCGRDHEDLNNKNAI